ncbi:MAG: hypothetical protein JRF53_08060 [Deltaproteobacteria bacterium]|nr:hypothetical protein [Deltaproteobacteria bacterium]
MAWIERNCPGCGAIELPQAFEKDDFDFRRCPHCNTLFVSPVPDQSVMDFIATQGESTRFLKSTFSSQLRTARYRHVLNSLLLWMVTTLDLYGISTGTYCACGSDDPGWMDIVCQESLFENIIAIRLNKNDFTDQPPPYKIVNHISMVPEQLDVISAFGILNKLSDPVGFIDQVLKKLVNGGVLFISAACNGFEYQVLERDAPNLLPLDRLTLFSTEALKGILEERGLKVLEISTPGRFDVGTVRDYAQKNQQSLKSPFWDYLFMHGDDRCLSQFQLFLQEHRLSSYLRMVARKES